jgi:branched-subunit amino acid ABC-type transport system permease component
MSMTLVQVVVSGLLLGAIYALFASGLTLIWGMMNVVNFAHGEFVMLGMYTAVVVWTALGGGPWASVPLAAILIATLGVASYFLLVRHIMRGPMLAQILGTSAWRCSCAMARSTCSAPTSAPCPIRWSAAPSCWAASASRAAACWRAPSASPSPWRCT